MSLTSRLEAIKKENAKVNSNTVNTNPVLSNISLFKKLEGIKANNIARTPQQESLPPAFDTTSAYRNPNTTSLNTSYQTSNPPVQPPVAPPAQEPTLRFPTPPTPGIPALSQNLGNLQAGLGKITGWAGEKLGQVIGGIEGFALGGLTGSMKPTDIKANLYRSINESKKLSKTMGEKGRMVGTAGGELIPGILKRVVDFTPTAAKVLVGREEDMIDYAADKFIEKYNTDIPFLTTQGAPQITKQQAKNYLLTGNFEGDQSKTDKYEVTKAWASSLFDIGLDLSMVGDIAAGALKGYYAKNVTKGYKPFSYTKTDFDNGLIQNVTSKGTKETRFTPQPGMGTMEVTAGAPTIGRRLTQPVFPLRGQGVVMAERGPSTAMTTTRQATEAPIVSEAGAVTQVAKGIPEIAAPAVRPQVAGPAIQSALPAGTPGARPQISPVDNQNAAFQIIDPEQAKTAQSLVKKLETTLKQKEAVMKENPTKTAIDTVKRLQTTINDLQAQIDIVRAKQNITTGPLVTRGQATVAPIEKPASALVAKAIETKPTIVPEVKKTNELKVVRYYDKYPNTDSFRGGTWWSDANLGGGVDYSTSQGSSVGGTKVVEKNISLKNPLIVKTKSYQVGSQEIANSKEVIRILSKETQVALKVLDKIDSLQGDNYIKSLETFLRSYNFPKDEVSKILNSGEESTNIARDILISNDLKSKGYDGIIHESKADNYFEGGTNPVREVFKFSDTPAKQIKIEAKPVIEKKELPVNIKARLEGQTKAVKEKTAWQKRQITKEEYESLERRKVLQKEKMETQKKYKDIQAQAIARQKAKDLQLVADAKIRIAKIRAEKAKQAEQEAIALKEQKEAHEAESLSKFEDSTGRIEASLLQGKAKEKADIEKLKSDLQTWKKEGKGEEFFHDLNTRLYEEFLNNGGIDKSEIVDKFIDDNFAMADGPLYSRVAFLPSEIANFLDKGWQGLAGNKLWKAYQKGLSKLSDVKVKLGEEKVVYPFEWLTGKALEEHYYPIKRELDKHKVTNAEIAKNLANEFGAYSTAEQEQIIKRIEDFDPITNPTYGTDDIGKAALKLEEAFVEAGFQLVERGLLKPEAFSEYMGKYFPRLNEAYYDAEKVIASRWKNRISNEFRSLRKDAWGVITGRKVYKFDTRSERDAFAKELRKKNKKYDTFAPLSEQQLEELKVIREIPPVIVSRFLQEKMAISLYDYYKTLSENKTISSKEQNIDKGFIKKIADDPKYGPLKGMYVNQRFYKEITELATVPNEALIIFRRLHSLVKGMKTIADVSVGVSNMVSNIILADAAGVPMERVDYWIRNLKDSLQGKGAYAELKKAGILSHTLADQELVEFGKLGKTDEEMLMKQFLKTKPTNAIEMLKVVGDNIKGFWAGLGKAYSFSENWGKSVVYDWAVNEMKMPKEEALLYADSALFNYGEVSRATRFMREIPLGASFITYPIKMSAKTAEVMARKPFTLLKLILAYGLWNAVTSEDEGMDPQALAIIKKYKTDLGKWAIPWMSQRSKSGSLTELQFLDTTRWNPFGGIITPPNEVSNISDLVPNINASNFVGSVSPFVNDVLVKPLIEVKMNKSSFTGQEIYKETDTDAEKLIKSIDYVSKAWLPSIAPSPTFSGEGGTLFTKYKDAIQGRGTWAEAGLRTIGLKTQKYNIDDIFKWERINAQGELKALSRDRIKILQDKKLTPEERTKEIEDLKQKIIERQTKIREILDDQKKLKELTTQK